MDEFTDAATRMLAVPISDERPWLVFGACRDADPMALWGAWPGEEPVEELMALLD